MPDTGLKGGEKKHLNEDNNKEKDRKSQIKTMEASDTPTLCHNQAQQLMEIKRD